MTTDSKPIIGVLASHDSLSRNQTLVDALDYLVHKHADGLQRFQLAMTRGTYRRVIIGQDRRRNKWRAVAPGTREFLINKCKVLRLPCRRHGGVVLMADLVAKRQLSVVWPFLTATTLHWLAPENVALLRLCDYCHANRLMNDYSVIEWARREFAASRQWNPQPVPPQYKAGGVNRQTDDDIPVRQQGDGSYALDWEALVRQRDPRFEPTLALIAHNEMKPRIEEFVLDYRDELQNFKRIITTGTTGKVVEDMAPELADKVRRYNSGPKGGDIEIAAEMIFHRCEVAVFLVDPLSAHPHNEDIKVLFGAAILNQVRLLTNERQARSWMDRTGGAVDKCAEYTDWLKDRPARGMLPDETVS
jgi:methylglyoxal synthase